MISVDIIKILSASLFSRFVGSELIGSQYFSKVPFSFHQLVHFKNGQTD